ncbi:unnamed protein product [Zymoseptoria tritici ST99CH_3D1]|nr:unnamed protein product [Zymoseptoria tritici ST99CH_3D1]
MQIKFFIATVFAVMAAADPAHPKGDRGQDCPNPSISCNDCDGNAVAPGHCGPLSQYSGCGCDNVSGYGFPCPSVVVDCSDCDGQNGLPGFCGPADSRFECGCNPNLSTKGYKCPSTPPACSSCDEVHSPDYAKCGPASSLEACGCNPNF